MSSSISPVFVMTCFSSRGKNRNQLSRIESAVWITCSESSLVAVVGFVDMAKAAHRTAPTRYAKDENTVLLVWASSNSRLSKPWRDLGSGISWIQESRSARG